ncbi:MAG: hypothetical protein AVDCRST_MAG08-419, partial [uncultured Acetobacteraceae bacterium]
GCAFPAEHHATPRTGGGGRDPSRVVSRAASGRAGRQAGGGSAEARACLRLHRRGGQGTRRGGLRGAGAGGEPVGDVVPALRRRDAGARPHAGGAGRGGCAGAGAVLGPRGTREGGAVLPRPRHPPPRPLARPARRGAAGVGRARVAHHRHHRPQGPGAGEAGRPGRVGQAGDAGGGPAARGRAGAAGSEAGL